MRRRDREIQDRERISEIIRSCCVCRLALAKDNVPYLVPVSFGYDGEAIYIHTARIGAKIDIIESNNAVCFEFEHGVELVSDETNPCEWTFHYETVIGHGTICELVDRHSKTHGLNQIMRHYSGQEWSFGAESLQGIRVWKIIIESLTGKQSRPKTT